MSPATASTPLLDGIRVLDCSSVGPGSRASRWLADFGAQVVKIGPPRRKAGVQIDPPFHSYGAGRGMSRIRIDLKSPAGRDVFLRLAGEAQVVIESYRPGVADRLGIGYDAVRRVSPGIVYCSTSGYGQEGPCSRWAGHDLNYLAMGGYLACCEARGDGGPSLPGATVADSAGGGLQAVASILAALVHCARSGEGRYLDVSAADGVISLLSLAIDQRLATGESVGPRETLLTGRYACYDLYRARDDRWLSVGAIEPHFFRNICRALGLEQYAEDQLDDSRQDEIRGAFREAFAERDRDDWVQRLAPADTCVAPVYSVDEVARDAHFRSRGLFMRAEHPERGRFEQVAPVLAGALRSQPTHRLRPADETDCAVLLAELGMSEREIEALESSGAVE
ncbi:MAG: CaiB/BaiF CoA transferase family protein [Myxococcota bacterium]